MSDGPFMSPLPEKCWNAVLERAANTSFSIVQIKEEIIPALVEHSRAMPDLFLARVKAALAASEDSIFKPGESGEIETLRQEARGNAFALLITECCEDHLETKGPDSESDVKVLTNALCERWDEVRRQLEEFAQREALDQAIAPLVRERLRQASPTGEELKALAQSLLNLSAEAPARKAPKHKALEDGPALAPGDDTAAKREDENS